MATRAELRECCRELNEQKIADIDYKDMSIEEMKEAIKNSFDKIYKNSSVKRLTSADQFSRNLLKFLTMEYDYVLRDKNGNELNYDYKE